MPSSRRSYPQGSSPLDRSCPRAGKSRRRELLQPIVPQLGAGMDYLCENLNKGVLRELEIVADHNLLGRHTNDLNTIFLIRFPVLPILDRYSTSQCFVNWSNLTLSTFKSIMENSSLRLTLSQEELGFSSRCCEFYCFYHTLGVCCPLAGLPEGGAVVY